MKLSVSSIAWQDGEEAEALAILHAHDVEAIELVPRRVAGDPPGDPAMWRKAREEWTGASLVPCAFQAILYGYARPMHLFQDEAQARNLLDHLSFVSQAAGAMGIGAIIFGSPKQRWVDEALISHAEAYRHAIDFFRKAGAVAAKAGTCICMEPNPAAYNCNFLTHTLEAARFVRDVDSAGIGLNLDAGTLAMNSEPVEETWGAVQDVVRHVHISDPHLKPVGMGGDAVHRELARMLVQTEYAGFVSLEMGRSGDASWQGDLDRALTFVRNVYYEA